MSQRMARLVEYNPQAGQKRLSLNIPVLNLKFRLSVDRSLDWKPVSELQEEFLKNYRSVKSDPNSPYCFEFCNKADFDDAKKLKDAHTLNIVQVETHSDKLIKESEARAEALVQFEEEAEEAEEPVEKPKKKKRQRKKSND